MLMRRQPTITQATGSTSSMIQAAMLTTVWLVVARNGAWNVWRTGVAKTSQPRTTPVTIRVAPTTPLPRTEAKTAGGTRRPRRDVMTCICHRVVQPEAFDHGQL